jgi:glycolate dehydrogenase FAD-binding subunit
LQPEGSQLIPTMDAALKSASALSPALREKFIALLSPEHARPAAPADAILGVQPQLLLEPADEQQLAAALRLANEAGLTVIPRGGGTKLSWGNPPSRADVILSTARLSQIIEHAWADLTVSVEGGCTIEHLQNHLAQHGQRLAIDPLWPQQATVGGILSANESGALRLRFGALRDLIIGVTIALPDSTLASSGGKVVKNVAGYDLPKLVTGAFGTLGVITRAVFRLYPRPHNTRSFSISSRDAAQAQQFVLAIQDSKLAHTSLQSRFSSDASPISDILFEGTEAGLNAQESLLRKLCVPSNAEPASAEVWNARQSLWNHGDSQTTAIAKFSILPAQLAQSTELLQRTCAPLQLRWQSLVYATGLGWLRLQGNPATLRAALQALRDDLQKKGGSLVVFHRPQSLLSTFDVWGNPGDALPLMKSLKAQLDPRRTLNPGRFVGGI